jgi:hypothetical protein
MENLSGFKVVKFFRESNTTLLGLVNDNGDDKDHSVTTFRLVGVDAINFKFENTSMACL